MQMMIKLTLFEDVKCSSGSDLPLSQVKQADRTLGWPEDIPPHVAVSTGASQRHSVPSSQIATCRARGHTRSACRSETRVPWGYNIDRGESFSGPDAAAMRSSQLAVQQRIIRCVGGCADSLSS